ncbi:hypothetical protein U9M48_014928 [Paspalum notatum var. saurae]|uniref:BZIP domain-containing protein n=1 Tax=Paspalum notatum var. saurae TaxID=547442 RepID=A0AAQ3WL02_PASNO
MDEDRSADPAARRARLLSPPRGQPQPQASRAPAVALPMDLNSQYQRRFAPSLFLPPMVPRLASGSGFSAFTNYQGPPTLAPAPAAPGAGSLLSPSLPKPLFFSTESLGPLPYSAAPAAGAGAVRRSPPSPPGSEQQGPSEPGLPPPGVGHRRSRSDFLVGFSRPNQLSMPVAPAAEGYSKPADAAALEELFRSYRDPKVLGVLGSAGDSSNERNEHLGNQVSGQRAWSPANSSDNEAESWATTGGGGVNHPRHCRSLSMDSIVGSLNFGAMGRQVSPRLLLPPPLEAGTPGGSLSYTTGSGPSGGAVAAAASSNKLANGEFSESEMKKIMANDRLAEIAIADPKRVKRILANRVSAARSKERRLKYMGELERKVHVLQMETTTLASKAALTQREYEVLKVQNNEMKIRLHALDQQAVLKDALNEALSSEVQRLKHIAGEASDPHLPKGLHHHMNRQILEQQLLQPLKQQPQESGQFKAQPSETQQQQQQQPQESGQFKAQQKLWNH